MGVSGDFYQTRHLFFGVYTFMIDVFTFRKEICAISRIKFGTLQYNVRIGVDLREITVVGTSYESSIKVIQQFQSLEY